MNQHQRKFLLEQLEKQYRKELSALNSKKPSEPNLNNYLIAAILDGSAKLRTQDEIREHIRSRVRDLGKGDALVCSSRWDSKNGDTISLPAVALFHIPEKYVEVKNQYDSNFHAWQSEVDALESSINALRIKVQVGSDAALESLVNQADRICSVSLTASSKLLLGSPVNE